MNEIIQIKCPFDGAVLSVQNQPGIETKNVTCPVCRHKYPFTQFKRVVPAAAYGDGATEYPGSRDDATSYGPAPQPAAAGQQNLILGKITVVGSGRSYQLRPGRNVIGRKAQKSTADFQIDTADKRAMSREHIVIEVKKVAGKGFVHYISLFKEKVNSTAIGSEPLLFGDRIVLRHGDTIHLPDAALKFEIPDDDCTDLTI